MEQRTCEVHGFNVRVTSYAVGKKFACRVDNVDPGHVIGRAVEATRKEAEESALRGAEIQLSIARAQIDLRESVHAMRSFQSERESSDED